MFWKRCGLRLRIIWRRRRVVLGINVCLGKQSIGQLREKRVHTWFGAGCTESEPASRDKKSSSSESLTIALKTGFLMTLRC
jgi:hypothetical protein